MPDGNVSGVRPASILSPEELDALRFAQDLYGAQAKQAAEELANVLEELDETGRDQLIGSVALRLDGLNFEERRNLVFSIRSLSEQLGGVATIGAGYVEVGSNGQGPQSEPAATTPAVATEGESDPSAAPQNETGTPAPAFAKYQRSWLRRLYEEENMEQIEALSLEERAEFFANLTAYYQQLSIPRLNSNAKAKRSDQLVALMVDGKSYSELAEEAGVSHAGVRLGITKMAESITKRSNPDQLQALIPAPKTVDKIEVDEVVEPDQGPANPETVVERSEATAWLTGLYSEAQLDIIDNLSAADRTKFGHALAETYSSLRIRRLEDKGRQIRVQLIELIISGESVKSAGQSLGLNTTRVKDVLARTADGFMKQTTPSERSVLLANCLDPAQSPHVGAGEQRGLPQVDTVVQKKWLDKVFEDGESVQASLAELEPEQLKYFVARLTSRLNSSIIKSQGPQKTARRIKAVEMLLIDGASYEAIAEATDIDVKTVKEELHHSSQRLKNKNQPQDLTALVRDAQAFSPETSAELAG